MCPFLCWISFDLCHKYVNSPQIYCRRFQTSLINNITVCYRFFFFTFIFPWKRKVGDGTGFPYLSISTEILQKRPQIYHQWFQTSLTSNNNRYWNKSAFFSSHKEGHKYGCFAPQQLSIWIKNNGNLSRGNWCFGRETSVNDVVLYFSGICSQKFHLTRSIVWDIYTVMDKFIFLKVHL